MERYADNNAITWPCITALQNHFKIQIDLSVLTSKRRVLILFQLALRIMVSNFLFLFSNCNQKSPAYLEE